jgi:hypothetical protein
MFREDDQIKKRLSAYFENEIVGESNKSKVSNLFVGREFLIKKYDVSDFIKLYATSRKLILDVAGSFFEINYDIISGIYCDVPFKGDTDPHVLNIVTSGRLFLKVYFNSTVSLMDARNEIYKIINTVMVDWKGSQFRVDSIQDRQFDVVEINR